MVQGPALCGANVIENRASRRGGRRLARQPEAFQRNHSKMIFQQGDGMVGSKNPIVQRSFGPHRPGSSWLGDRAGRGRFIAMLKKWRRRSIEDFSGPQLLQ